MIRIFAFLILSATLLCSPAFAQQACSTACDLNGDKLTTFADYSVFITSFNKQAGQPGFSAAADLNGDGVVNGADFAILVKFCPIR